METKPEETIYILQELKFAFFAIAYHRTQSPCGWLLCKKLWTRSKATRKQDVRPGYRSLSRDQRANKLWHSLGGNYTFLWWWIHLHRFHSVFSDDYSCMRSHTIDHMYAFFQAPTWLVLLYWLWSSSCMFDCIDSSSSSSSSSRRILFLHSFHWELYAPLHTLKSYQDNQDVREKYLFEVLETCFSKGILALIWRLTKFDQKKKEKKIV